MSEPIDYRVTWSDERVECLKTLWADGYSAADVAAELGGGLTRNAVLGKIHRLGLSQRDKKSKPGKKPSGLPRRRQPKRFLTLAPRLPFIEDTIEVLEHSPNPISFFGLGPNHCRWPISGEGMATLFCGNEQREPHSYCAAHCRMAFTKRQSLTEGEKLEFRRRMHRLGRTGERKSEAA